jgi:hypothetical protein
MHLGKTERCPASFVDDALGNCLCSGESRVCVKWSLPAGNDWFIGSHMARTHLNRRDPCLAIQSVLSSIELICRFNST